MAFASGKYAKGLCDRCGWEYKYLQLKVEKGTNLKVCPECNDFGYSIVSHPQNYAPKDLSDNIALKNPRPENEAPEGVFVFGQTSAGQPTDYVGILILEE